MCCDLSPSLSPPLSLLLLLPLSYAKVEGLEPTSSEMLQFRFLLVSAGDFELYKETHSIVGKAEGFSGFSVNLKEFPPIKIALRDSIAVLALKGCRSTGDG